MTVELWIKDAMCVLALALDVADKATMEAAGYTLEATATAGITDIKAWFFDTAAMRGCSQKGYVTHDILQVATLEDLDL